MTSFHKLEKRQSLLEHDPGLFLSEFRQEILLGWRSKLFKRCKPFTFIREITFVWIERVIKIILKPIFLRYFGVKKNVNVFIPVYVIIYVSLTMRFPFLCEISDLFMYLTQSEGWQLKQSKCIASFCTIMCIVFNTHNIYNYLLIAVISRTRFTFSARIFVGA